MPRVQKKKKKLLQIISFLLEHIMTGGKKKKKKKKLLVHLNVKGSPAKTFNMKAWVNLWEKSVSTAP